MDDLNKIGKECRKLRRSLDKTQNEVGKEIGYTAQNISSFERGKLNNAVILIWYINHGLSVEVLRG